MTNTIFGGGDKQPGAFQEKVETHSKAILTVVERQKDLESATDLLDEKLELLDHNSVKNFKKTFEDSKSLRADFRDLKQELTALKDANRKIAKQLQLLATRDEVSKLDKYIDLWNPMNFITRDELEDNRQKIKKDFEQIIEKFLSK